jgi:hypothetical protein
MKRTQTSCFVVLVFVGLAGCAMHRAQNGSGCCDGGYQATVENGAPCGAPGEACGRSDCSDSPDGYFHPGAPCDQPCARCGHCPCCCGRGQQDAGAGGPPAVGTVTYPYYTVRGPRDFLAKNPPSIGP